MKLLNHSLTRFSVAIMAASSLLLLVLWHVTTPAGSGPIGILAAFTLVYLFFTALALFVTGLWSLFTTKILGKGKFDDRRRYYVSSVLGFLPVLYLTLMSMGGASFWGIVLIILFIGLMLFYVLRRSA